MHERIRNVSTRLLARNWGTLEEVSFDFRRGDGAWQALRREVYDHGSAAAVLLHCPETNRVLLVRQFRWPVHAAGRDGFLLEVCAGLLDGDSPEACARREALEETGVAIKTLRHVLNADMSPGSLTETVACFIGEYDAAARLTAGGGLVEEGEDIEVVELAFDAAFAMIGRGEITDAKTIMLLQHLALGR